MHRTGGSRCGIYSLIYVFILGGLLEGLEDLEWEEGPVRLGQLRAGGLATAWYLRCVVEEQLLFSFRFRR